MQTMTVGSGDNGLKKEGAKGVEWSQSKQCLRGGSAGTRVTVGKNCFRGDLLMMNYHDTVLTSRHQTGSPFDASITGLQINISGAWQWELGLHFH